MGEEWQERRKGWLLTSGFFVSLAFNVELNTLFIYLFFYIYVYLFILLLIFQIFYLFIHLFISFFVYNIVMYLFSIHGSSLYLFSMYVCTCLSILYFHMVSIFKTIPGSFFLFLSSSLLFVYFNSFFFPCQVFLGLFLDLGALVP